MDKEYPNIFNNKSGYFINSCNKKLAFKMKTYLNNLLILCIIISCNFTFLAAQNTFFVSNTNDSGLGSFRDAIIQSNIDGTASQIHFDIQGTPPHVIVLSTPLSTILDDETEIDGTTQPDYFDGAIVLVGQGISIGNLNNSVSNISINGLYINDSPFFGISIDNCDGCIIGKIDGGNIISGNETGIQISNSNNITIQGNKIGTDTSGEFPQGNEKRGIWISTSENVLIGGSQIEEGNTIAYNTTGQPAHGGIFLANAVQNCTISNNSIFCNGDYGIRIFAGSNGDYPRPNIIDATTTFIKGTALPNDIIDVFRNEKCLSDSCQGEMFLGEAIADANGEWILVTTNEVNKIVSAVATSEDGNSSPFSSCKSIINSTSLEKIEENNINIYPNPTSDYLFISSTKNDIQKIEIFNQVGQLIMTKSKDRLTFLKVNLFTKGKYYLRITFPNSIILKSVTKI